MNETEDLQCMDEAQMRQLLQHVMGELKPKQTLLDKLTYEMAILKRLKFAANDLPPADLIVHSDQGWPNTR